MKLLTFVSIALAMAVSTLAQHPQVGDPNAEGESLYRSNCAFCHGVTGKGGRGPDLTGRRSHGDTVNDVKQVIKEGIPGTTMPAFANFADDELARLTDFVQKLSIGGKSTITVNGNAAAGKKIYDRSGCSGCHQIAGQGGIYGPDLSRIGAARSTEYIRDSIVKPSADIPTEWEGLSVIAKDGKKISGLRVNEDTFTIQMRDPSGKFRLLDKADLQTVTYSKQSAMPTYDKLSKTDLDNLLAYLDTLRGAVNASGPATKAKGIQ